MLQKLPLESVQKLDESDNQQFNVVMKVGKM